MKRHNIILAIAAVAFSAPAVFAQMPADSVETTGTKGLSVNGAVLENKVLGDVRNQLTGMIPGLEVTENAGGLWNGADYESFIINSDQLTLKYRGDGALTTIIDGVVVPYNIYNLDPAQIESITLLGDIVDRAKFGPMASNGAISIKTKSGGYNQPMRIAVKAEGGVAFTGIVPEWADGVDYALLNNEARYNAGYTQLYSPLAIQGYLRKDAYDLQYPNVDYKSLMMANVMPVSNASISITGGTAKTKYAAIIGETFSGDIVKTNESQDYNKINLSFNVTTKINHLLTVNAGFNSLLSFRRAGKASWNDWQNVPGVAYPVILGVNGSDDAGDPLSGLTIYGTTANWKNNYYANLVEGGFQTRRCRSGMLFANITLDFGKWIKGFKSVTGVAYSTFMATTVSKSNDYLSYYWDPSAEDGMGNISPDHQGVKASGKTISSAGANQFLQLKEDLIWDWERNGHNINLDGSFLMYDASLQGVGYYRRLMQAVGSFKYSYKDRYILEGAAQYVGSTRFDKDSRFRPFASVGAAWVISNEEWMKDVSWIDRLKIRAQYGTNGEYSSAFGTEYLYQSLYSQGNGYKYGPTLTLDTWFGDKQWTSQKSSIIRLANDNLTWEARKSWEAGLEFNFCKGFSFIANVYGFETVGEIVNATSSVPAIYGISSKDVYANYSSNKTFGYEVGLSYNRRFGDFGVNAGVSAYHWNATYNKILNDDYLYEYQKKTGTSTASIWGFECTGKYKTQEQIETAPAYSADVKIGDLMYKDQNGDGIIDANDKVIIGSTQPKLRYSVNLGFSWKNLDIQAVGTGRYGYDFQATSDYFWSGWGDGLYTAFVRDNIGGAYPNLSYTKSSNNFVASTFWLRDASWFKIQDVCISYTVPIKNQKVVKGLKFSVKGQNLATFSNMDYVDPEAPSSGISLYPLFRTVTAGAKIIF